MEYLVIKYVIKIVLFLLGLFFSSMAIGGYLISFEEFRNRKKIKEKSDYKMKAVFALIPLSFSFIFLYVGYTINF